jgi:hypothetical protein
MQEAEDATMRALLATYIVAIWTTTGLLTAAKAQTWCIRDRAGVTSQLCAFSSAHDCIRAALIGSAGGTVCAQQTRSFENERRGAFPNDNVRLNSGPPRVPAHAGIQIAEWQ